MQEKCRNVSRCAQREGKAALALALTSHMVHPTRSMQSIIEHIVEEICKRCDSDHHVAVSADLAASMVRAVLIDPANHFQLERELRTEDVARLIALAVDNLCATNSPALETMKMQLAFESARSKTEREQPVSPEQPAPGSELANILEEILKSRATGVAALSGSCLLAGRAVRRLRATLFVGCVSAKPLTCAALHRAPAAQRFIARFSTM